MSHSLCFFIAYIVSIGAGDNPFAFIGGALFALPVACYAIAEWVCCYGKRHSLIRPLGVLNLLVAAFFRFGLIMNVGEAFMTDERVDLLFILIFGVGFAFVVGYLAWCGWRRVHAITAVADAIHRDG